MVLKLYYDLMSQPCRALYIILKSAKCNFESHIVDLRKGAHFSEDYTKINPRQRVPVIDHDGFILTESQTFTRSVAILSHLSRVGLIPEQLSPRAVRPAACVDEFLSWQHVGLRLHCAMYFRVVYMDPILYGRMNTVEQLNGYKSRMEQALSDLDTKWLGRGAPYLGGETPTVADVMAACELEQPRMAGYDPAAKFANIAAWWLRVRADFSPHYEEAHVILNKIIAKNAARQAKL